MEQLTRRRYIDANELQERLERKKAGIANKRYTEGWNDCMMCVKSMVSKAPTAAVAPVVYGQWLDGRCTACGWEEPDSCGYDGYETEPWQHTLHCPNCGVKMNGVE